MNFKNKLDNKKVLVTGGAGFIGSHLVDRLVSEGANVLVFDKFTYASVACRNMSANYFGGDICKFDSVFQALANFAPNCVMHLAAESHVGRSIEDPSHFIDTNVNGTYTLLEALRKLTTNSGVAPMLLHCSTDEVFGDLPVDSVMMFNEDSPYRPSNPYSASKAASDHLIRAWGRTYGLPFVITHAANNYGPRQLPDKLVPMIITNALKNLPITIHGNGSNVRNWLYVEDHVEGMIRAMLYGVEGESYCFASNVELSNIDIAKLICAQMQEVVPDANRQFRENIVMTDDRPGNDKKYSLSTKKAFSELLGWTPNNDFRESIAKTIKWYHGRIKCLP